MSGLLNRMNRERKNLQKEGKSAFEEEAIAAYEREYAELIRKGREGKQEIPGTAMRRRMRKHC